MNIYGDKTSVLLPAHLNFGKYILDKLRQVDDVNKACLVDGDTREVLTYKDVTQNAVNLATAFMRLGVKRGDVVALCSTNTISVMPTALAAILTGSTFVFYELGCGRAIIKHDWTILKPSYVICSQLFWERYNDVMKSFDFIKEYIGTEEVPGIDLTLKSLVSKDESIADFEPVDVLGQSDAAWIFFSSGTTGIPKAVPYTHYTFILECVSRLDYIDPSIEVAWTSGHWSFTYATIKSLKMLSRGKTVVCNFYIKSPNNVLRSIQDYKINIMFISPIFVKDVAKEEITYTYDLDSLKYIYSAGSPLAKPDIAEIKKRFKNVKEIFEGYGLTEVHVVTSLTWATKGSKSGSVGMVTPGMVVKVVDQTSRKRLGPNQVGEICVKDFACRKIYQKVDASQSYLDDEGFFITGDLGYYDEDEYFYITGRIPEMIKVNDVNVAPQHIESVLLDHPEVVDAGVVGNPENKPAAFVVKRSGSNVTEQDIISYISKEVPSHMWLTGGVVFVKEIPRSDRGKLLRAKLKDLIKNVNKFAFTIA